ncbi:MAG: hypothetical protein AVDCRST_MAG93-5292, partial [uncultured Chloroflexia bacterium]
MSVFHPFRTLGLSGLGLFDRCLNEVLHQQWGPNLAVLQTAILFGIERAEELAIKTFNHHLPAYDDLVRCV